MSSAAGPQQHFNVYDYGAKGDNTTDNTGAFTAALQAAYANKGGVVDIPTGMYRFEGNLTIPPGVTLAGSYSVVPSHDLRNHQALDDGSVLVPTGGRGAACDLDCTRAFITITQNAALRGVAIWYATQESVQLPVPFPWAVFLGDPDGAYNAGRSADNAAVTDVELLGAWNGVAAVAAHRHYIARVQGQPLNVGVFVDETYDIGRIENVHFNPWFSSAQPFVGYQTVHGRAFVMARSDWEYVLNTFAFGYAVGYHFIERQHGSMNGNFLGIGMDLATNASVLVEQSQPFGVLITNGEFTAFCDGGFCAPRRADGSVPSPAHVVVGPANVGAVKFVSSAFWGPAAAVARTAGTGTVSFTQCHFDAWDNHVPANASATGKPALEHRGTAAVQQVGGSLIMSQNEFVGGFAAAGIAHVRVGANASKTIFTANVLRGALNVTHDAGAGGKLIVSDNADDSP
eukprot:g523.t1